MRATKKLLCSLTFFLLGSLLVTAQQRTLTGKVQNKQGVGIAGAIISVVNSAKRTVTDNAGSFSIVVSASETQLSVTSFGFISKTVNFTASITELNIILEDDAKQLADVVVTAYGIKKETKRLGYSSQEVKGADLVKARDANPVNSLVGKVAGLSVGANPEMLGRPELVLRGSKDLLFVIDGVPVNTRYMER